jgi:hypothetical protein
MSAGFERLLRESVRDLASEGRPVDLSTRALRGAGRVRRIRSAAVVTAAVIVVVLVAGVAAAVGLGRSDRDVPPADPAPAPSTGSTTTSPDAGTAPVMLVGGWMIRSAPAADDSVIVYDDDAGRYRKVGTSDTVLPSPNGRYLAVMGQSAMMVTAVSDGRVMYQKTFVSTNVRPVWSADSTRLAIVTYSPDGMRVRTIKVADGTEAYSDVVDCPDGCMLKWLEDGEHVRVYTGSRRLEVTIRGGAVGAPSATPDDPCGPTVRAFRVDGASWLCVTSTGFAVTTTAGTVSTRIPFPQEIDALPVATGNLNYVLSRRT